MKPSHASGFTAFAAIAFLIEIPLPPPVNTAPGTRRSRWSNASKTCSQVQAPIRHSKPFPTNGRQFSRSRPLPIHHTVAHGARPALIGKNLLDLKDQDGKYLIREMIRIARGSGAGWVNYKWPNPINNKIEDKVSYVEKMGDFFVGVGVYRE